MSSALLPPDGIPADKWLSKQFSGDAKAMFESMGTEYDSLQPIGGVDKAPDPIRVSGTSREFTKRGRYVVGYNKRQYIASRGPTEATVEDFWTMVAQERAGAITQANGADKPFKYYPTSVGDKRIFGPWTIECLKVQLKQMAGDKVERSEAEGAKCMYRLLRLSLTGPTGKPKELWHLKWPDGGLPAQEGMEAADYLVRLVEILRADLKMVSDPVVVHCMGGMGRTGVVIMLDICAARLLSAYKVDVLETLTRVRQQRPQAVLNRSQYVYINLVLAQLALKRLEKKQLPSVFGPPGAEKKVRKCIEECLKIAFDTLPKR